MYITLYSSSGLYMGAATVLDEDDDSLIIEVEVIKSQHRKMLREARELEADMKTLDERLRPNNRYAKRSV